MLRGIAEAGLSAAWRPRILRAPAPVPFDGQILRRLSGLRDRSRCAAETRRSGRGGVSTRRPGDAAAGRHQPKRNKITAAPPLHRGGPPTAALPLRFGVDGYKIRVARWIYGGPVLRLNDPAIRRRSRRRARSTSSGTRATSGGEKAVPLSCGLRKAHHDNPS